MVTMGHHTVEARTMSLKGVHLKSPNYNRKVKLLSKPNNVGKGDETFLPSTAFVVSVVEGYHHHHHHHLSSERFLLGRVVLYVCCGPKISVLFFT
jgi:hypothetical protein